jgi:two-component system response regulator FixJ
VIRRVVVIDDDAAVLESLDALFTTAGYEVYAFGSANAFLARLDILPPACIVTDLRMPDMDGLTLVNRLKRELHLAWPVVVISGHADVAQAVSAMQAGAVDFLVKPFPPQRLLAIVNACLLTFAAGSVDPTSAMDHRYSTLSARERQVVELLISGGSSKTAALALGISPRTVDVFRGKILRKMDVTNIAALSTAIATVSVDLRGPGKTT